jgi:hypothetical protein
MMKRRDENKRKKCIRRNESGIGTSERKKVKERRKITEREFEWSTDELRSWKK